MHNVILTDFQNSKQQIGHNFIGNATNKFKLLLLSNLVPAELVKATAKLNPFWAWISLAQLVLEFSMFEIFGLIIQLFVLTFPLRNIFELYI